MGFLVAATLAVAITHTAIVVSWTTCMKELERFAYHGWRNPACPACTPILKELREQFLKTRSVLQSPLESFKSYKTPQKWKPTAREWRMIGAFSAVAAGRSAPRRKTRTQRRLAQHDLRMLGCYRQDDLWYD